MAIATALARRGIRVAIADIQVHALDEAAHAIGQAGPAPMTLHLDVTDREKVGRSITLAEQHFGRIDLAFNNAGIGDAGTRVDQVSNEFFDWIVGINLTGAMNVMKAVVPALRRAGAGSHLVNTSSMAGLVVMPGWNQGIYSATKMAVLALSLDLRYALEPEKIGVSALCPGLVQTAITENALRLRPASILGDSPDFPDMLTQGGMSPSEAAEITIRGVEENRPIILTHPDLWPLVEQHHKLIRQAFMQD